MNETSSVITKFTIRVYGIFIKNSKILLVKENLNGFEFTKFPGGGLEFGEGLQDGLRREIMEEMEQDIEIKNHFYTTDFFQRSAFKLNEQVVSVYYLAEVINCPDFEKFPLSRVQPGNHTLAFYWTELQNLNPDDVTFPIDKIVVAKILSSNFICY